MNNFSPAFAIVIPAYNEESTIHDITLRALTQSDLVIVVEDGSTDNTLEQLEGLPITLIAHSENQGKAASLWDGVQSARQHNVDYIVTLDGDGQHAPEDIPSLFSKSAQHPEHIIVGARLADKSAIPAKRYYANRIANFWISWAAGYPISDTQSGFRIYPAGLFDDLSISTAKHDSFVFESEIIILAAQKNIKCTSVAIPAVYAENARPSHFRGVRDITYITLMVGRSLIKRGMYLQGLYRSSIKPHLLAKANGKMDYDGYGTALLSLLIIFLTFGFTLLAMFVYVCYIALTARKESQTGNVVMLGKRLQNNLPDYDYRLRLDRAVEVNRETPDQHYFILGGHTGDAEISEAEAGKRYLIDAGLEEKQIHCEENSRNTLENFRNLKAGHILDTRQISLITNRHHLARAGVMAGGFGFGVNLCAAEDQYKFGFINSISMLMESLLLHWYFAGKLYANITCNKRMLARIQ